MRVYSSPSTWVSPAKQLHEWQRENKLAAGIWESYCPRKSRYLSWFAKNQHSVDANYIRPGGFEIPPNQGERISKDFFDHRWILA
jgi:hypothetical protein